MMWVMRSLLLTALAGAAFTQVEEAHTDGAQLDGALVERFGRLPLRFNGRMTTFAEYAPHALHGVGFAETVLDPNGRPASPTRWLLETLADHPRAPLWRCLDVSPAMAEAGLSPAPEGEPPYAPADLYEAERVGRAGALIEGVLLQHVRLNLGHPALEDAADAPRFPLAVLEAHLPTRQALPRDVALLDGGGVRWTSYAEAVAAGSLDAAGLVALDAVLGAARADDAELFTASLDAYEGFLIALPHDPPAVAYAPPPGWVEVGVPTEEQPSFHADAGGAGQRVASFLEPGATPTTGEVVYLPGATRSDAELEDAWRLAVGLLPAALDPTPLDGIEVEVAGERCRVLCAETAGGPHRVRALGLALRHGSGTWLATVQGPRLKVRRVQREWIALLESLVVTDDPGRARRWCSFPEGSSPAPPTVEGVERAYGLFVEGERTWLAAVSLRGVGSVEQELGGLLEGLRGSPEVLDGEEPFAGGWVPSREPTGPSWPLVRLPPRGEHYCRGVVHSLPAIDLADAELLVEAVHLAARGLPLNEARRAETIEVRGAPGFRVVVD